METNNQTKFNKNNIPRCPKCSLIPLIEIINDNNQAFINFKCENKHEGKMSLEAFIEDSKKNSIFKIKCQKCQKEPDDKKNLIFVQYVIFSYVQIVPHLMIMKKNIKQ